MRTDGKRFLYASLMLLCLATAASADIKIKSRTSFGGQQGPETTTYIKGKRQRSELPGRMATVTQCDLRRTLQLNDATRTYVVSPFDDGSRPEQAAAGGAPSTPSRRGGVVTTTVTTTDTGERKQMFGYTARRIKTSMVTESSPDACNVTKSRMESDGWYIDLAVEFDCYDRGAAAGYRVQRQGGCQDTYRMKQTGAAKTGYPVSVTTIMYDEGGKASGSFTQEVLEISKAALDAALFEVPSDYREVRDASELYSAAALADAARGADVGDDDSDTSGTNNASNVGTPSSTTAAPTVAVGPKRPGVVRVGVALPKATAAEGIDPNRLAEAVRDALVNSLSGPAVEVVGLESHFPAQLAAEAKQKECDFVVVTAAAHKKGGGGFGMFKKLAPVVGGTYGGADGGAAAGGDFSASVKAKDELTLEYTLQKGAAPVASNKLKAKAKSDGEDLVSQLVGQAAAAVLAEATRK